MKTRIKQLFLLPALVAALGLIPAGRVTAQTFTDLYSFTADTSGTNSDGAYPSAGLILGGNTLYGTTRNGGTNGTGTVFAVNTDGTGFTTLHSFTALVSGTNSDGANPVAGLLLEDDFLYGTAQSGGSGGNGTVFAVNIFGSGFTNLHNFTALSAPFNGTNSDGANPEGRLILSSNAVLYGTASDGGSGGDGTVFALNADGMGFTNLYSFTAFLNNSDGANPFAGLVLSGNTLYGTTHSGGTNDGGTVFAVNINGAGFNGAGFTNLHTFTGTNDGDNPYAGLIVAGTTLFGTAGNGGAGYGTLFAVNTSGSNFTTLHTFTYIPDGGSPRADLILSSNTIYGTAGDGGTNGTGMLFSLSLPTPPLTINRSATNVVLTWPTNALQFTLQSTTNLAPPTIWSAVFPPPIPVVVNGTNTVTIPNSGAQEQFYQLSL